jgi:cathepsin A (carboxypeptidase C)
MYKFLELWFRAFGKSKNDFYIAGESFGGTWVPLLAEKIMQKQVSRISQVAQAFQYNASVIPLKGILLGNAGISQRLQYSGYYEIGCTGDTPLFNKTVCEDMMLASPRCESWYAACSMSGYDHMVCNPLLDECRSYNMFQIFQVKLNPYDFRPPCEDLSHCYAEEKDAEAYLNRRDVQEQLGVAREFHSCNSTTNQAFVDRGALGHPTEQVVGRLLDQGLRVLIYVGRMDWYCNYPGQRRMSNSLVWYGMEAFRAKELESWTYRGAVAGLAKAWGNLAYAEIEGAGHMSPKDKPAEVEQLVFSWLGKSTTG